MAPGEDFVHVRLTAAGQQKAGEAGYVRVVQASSDFIFRVGVAQRVTKAWEWEMILKPKRDSHGEPLFEVVPPAAPAQKFGRSGIIR